MINEIERLKGLLANEDPKTANYGVIVGNLCQLVCAYEALRSIVSRLEEEAPVEEAPVEEAPVEKAPAEKKKAAKKLPAIEDVRKVILDAQTKGVDVRPFITQFGVKNLSAIPEENYPDLIKMVLEAANNV